MVVMDFTMDDLRESQNTESVQCCGRDGGLKLRTPVIAANIVAPHRKLTYAKFRPYAEGKTDNLWGRYAGMAWKD